MNAPNVPLRLDLSFELPGSPEQVWDAIATSGGISSWFIDTEIDERLGGAVRFSMGPEAESAGSITGWDPPHRVAYVEPEWADLSGHGGAAVTPLTTEFLVEAQSGGTCVVRVVSSAFGTGAEWEREFFAEMERGWPPFFANLRLYLAEFAGQRATTLRVSVERPGCSAEALFAGLRTALGAEEPGQPIDAQGLRGELASVTDAGIVVRVTEPERGYFLFSSHESEAGATFWLAGYLFSAGAAAYVERERQGWQEWLGRVPVETVGAAARG
jgi:uncharacterized protein YndB with AHSA1/START domain